MLVAVTLLVLMMTVIVMIFASATGAVSGLQVYQQLDGDLRQLDITIRRDLTGVTARMTPPLNPRDGRGYGVVIDVRTGKLGPSHPSLGSPSTPSVDADGRRMAIVSHGAAAVQPLIAGRPAGRPRFYRRSGGALSVTLSPDGRALAVQTGGGIEIVDVARMRISGFLLDSDTTVTAPVFIGNSIVAAGSREGEEQIVARLEPTSKVKRREQAQLWADTAKLHLFDPESGERLIG